MYCYAFIVRPSGYFREPDELVEEKLDSLEDAIQMERDWHTCLGRDKVWGDTPVKHFHAGS